MAKRSSDLAYAATATGGGIFVRYQPKYDEIGLPTIPVTADKKPGIKRPHKVGRQGSADLVAKKRFRGWNGIGLWLDNRRLLVDLETRDPAAISYIKDRYGETPFQADTPRGRHFWYRHPGENDRLIKPDPDYPIYDVLSGGLAMLPPSMVAKGNYRTIESCTLEDMRDLPPARVMLDELRKRAQRQQPGLDPQWRTMRDGDGRHRALRLACQREVRSCDEHADLVDWAMTRNLEFHEQLEVKDVMGIVQWCWDITQEGRNWMNNQHIAVRANDLRSVMSTGNSDAVFLLMDLRDKHWGKECFTLATRGMCERYSWGQAKFRVARDILVDCGLIKEVWPATSLRPAIYGWGA